MEPPRPLFAGDPDAVHADELYRTLAPAVLGYMRAEGVADPEDLLGEVFFQVARDLHRFQGDAVAARHWVFTIARHRVIDAHRRRSVRPVKVAATVPDRAAPDPGLEAGWLDPQLVIALHQLTPEQREVVVLRFVADLPLRTVARVTGRRVGAVKALQVRALDRLSGLLTPPGC